MPKKIIFLILFLNLISNSFAVEKDYFMMLKYSKVNVRFGPSRNYPVKFIYKKAFLPVKIIDKGQLSNSYIEDDAKVYMREEKKIDIFVDLNIGKKNFTAYTMDLTKKYIEIKIM